MGIKNRHFSTLSDLSLEDLVPNDHLYCRLEFLPVEDRGHYVPAMTVECGLPLLALLALWAGDALLIPVHLKGEGVESFSGLGERPPSTGPEALRLAP